MTQMTGRSTRQSKQKQEEKTNNDDYSMCYLNNKDANTELFRSIDIYSKCRVLLEDAEKLRLHQKSKLLYANRKWTQFFDKKSVVPMHSLQKRTEMQFGARNAFFMY